MVGCWITSRSGWLLELPTELIKLLMEGVNRNTRLVEITMLLSRRHLFKYATFECLKFFGRSLLSALPLGVSLTGRRRGMVLERRCGE